MRIAVFGATGATGREVVAQALQAGHEVSALARRSGGLAVHDRLRVVVGELDQPDVVAEVVAGVDAVISALGTNEKGPVTVCSDGVRSMLGAMSVHRVRRLVVISAHGAAESRDHSLYVLAVWASVAHKMRDKEGMEELIHAADVDATIVRPPALSTGPYTGTYRTGPDLDIWLTSKVSRADLADYLLHEATTPTATTARRRGSRHEQPTTAP